MAIKLFAAIDVGSYEIGMKIFELSGRKGVKEIDFVRRRVEIGTDTYNTGKISYARMDELCDILNGFNEIMKGYKVDSYRAYGTSAIRETDNTRVVLDQIRLRTGLEVSVLSNSEQRFLDYKSVALKTKDFDRIIDRGTAFVDIGGGSTQVSLFSDSHLISTVNLRLGILRLKEKVNSLSPKSSAYESLLSELVDNELVLFKELYLRNLDTQNLIVVDDYLTYIQKWISQRNDGKKPAGEFDNYITVGQYVRFFDILKKMPQEQLARELGLPRENATLLMPSAVLIKQLCEVTCAERLFLTGVTLSDGIAYDYAESNKFIKSTHDFELDIISSARNTANRYRGSARYEETLEKCALAIFDSMKKMHGLGKRERLLLQLSSLLQDCGAFISLMSPAECSYSIIMGTEIIGISHMERKIIASVVMYSYPEDIDFEGVDKEEFSTDSYLTMAKLTAIFRIAVGMVKNPEKEYREVKAQIKDKELVITIDSDMDMHLERGLFNERTGYFEEVFGIHPIIKTKSRGGVFRNHV